MLLFFSVLNQTFPLTIFNLLSFSLVSLSYSVMFLKVLFVLTLTWSRCIVSGISIVLQPLISYNAEMILSVAFLHN